MLWIDRGREHGELNLSIFDQLHDQREAIEADFGGSLNWERMNDARSCKIVADVPSAPGWRDDLDDREDGLLALAQTMARFEKALSPRIAALDLKAQG